MDWERLLLAYVDDHSDEQPEPYRQQGRDLIAAGKYQVVNELVEDYSDEDWGLCYVVELLPADGKVIRSARVHWRRL